MRKVSFSFPEDLVHRIDGRRGALSRNQFVLRLLNRVLDKKHERQMTRITAEVYDDESFAREESALSEDFLRVAPEADL